MGRNIYDITDDYIAVIAEIENNDGEITEYLEEKLKIAEDELEEKLRAYRSVIKQNESFIDYNKDEIKRLRDRNKSFDNTKERLSKYIIPALHMFGNQTASGNFSIKYPDFSVSTRLSESVNINTHKVQTLLNAKAGLIEKDAHVAKVLLNNQSALDLLGDVEITIKVPFTEISKYSRELQHDSTAGVVWNIPKKNLKELIENRDHLHELISNGLDNEANVCDYHILNDFLNYIEAEIVSKESVNFR
jgi:hypothetical protein